MWTQGLSGFWPLLALHSWASHFTFGWITRLLNYEKGTVILSMVFVFSAHWGQICFWLPLPAEVPLGHTGQQRQDSSSGAHQLEHLVNFPEPHFP